MKKEKTKCVQCGVKSVWVKKWRLCVTCYKNAQQTNFEGFTPIVEAEHSKEINFIKNYFQGRTNWIYRPATFKIISEKNYTTKYTPDFYDGDRKVFIEVAGSRQAFHQNLDRYKKFKNQYPDIRFEIYTSDGSTIDFEKERQPNGTWDYNKK